jgi:beta-RFAP synthase
MVCGIDANVWDVAAAMGRGRRSGIGTAAFQTGGFVIDAGHRKGGSGRDAAPTVVWRRDFPSDWLFVVVVPDANGGLSGHSEEGVFGSLAPSVRISEEICRITQLRLMPALVEHDIEEFGRALTAVDRKTGSYFSDVQGGIYSGGETNAAIEALVNAGACGAGQSSWGPAVYGLVHDRDVAKVEAGVKESLARDGRAAQVFVSHARNTEARVEVLRVGL